MPPARAHPPAVGTPRRRSSSGDAGAESAFTAQYGELVQAAGACLHAACAAYGRATRRLRLQQPLLDGVDPARHYIACDQSALAGFDEKNFTVKDVKVWCLDRFD